MSPVTNPTMSTMFSNFHPGPAVTYATLFLRPFVDELSQSAGEAPEGHSAGKQQCPKAPSSSGHVKEVLSA